MKKLRAVLNLKSSDERVQPYDPHHDIWITGTIDRIGTAGLIGGIRLYHKRKAVGKTSQAKLNSEKEISFTFIGVNMKAIRGNLASLLR